MVAKAAKRPRPDGAVAAAAASSEKKEATTGDAAVAGGSTASVGGGADVAGAFATLRTGLHRLAPKLAPGFVPGSIPGSESEEALGRIFQTETSDSRALLHGVRERARERGLAGGDPVYHIEWDVDVPRRRKTPAKVHVLSRRSSLICDLPRLIETLAVQPGAKVQDHATASEMVQLFLSENGHDMGQAQLLQDAVAVAHSLHVLCKELRLSEAPGTRSLRELLADALPELRGDSCLSQAASDVAADAMTDAEGTAKGRKKRKV
eukprot:TRINITY_DN1262_c1_g1_i1.p1 TRINITY_DN1262_c1_g1~~TRINITY_DN1262_c1_g1_i1.p1  ORF type:complete len:293 (+),score=55.56 TRINITY_DN1262_c1_g1_i1:88-879(+)